MEFKFDDKNVTAIEFYTGTLIDEREIEKKCDSCHKSKPLIYFYPKSKKTKTANVPADYRDHCKKCYSLSKGNKKELPNLKLKQQIKQMKIFPGKAA